MAEPRPHPWYSPRVQWFFGPTLTCICLAFLIVLVFLGTLYQVEHGLHAAKHRYFDSYFLLLGGYIPFPGTQTVMLVLVASLLGYTVNLLLAPKLKLGMVVLHVGLLMLLLGGAITHRFAEESQLTLGEGEAANTTASYHEWELALIADRPDGARDVRAVDVAGLQAGAPVDFGVTGIEVRVESLLPCCLVDPAAPRENAPLNAMNIAGLRPVPHNKERERDLAGGVLAVKAGSGEAKRFLLFGEGDTSVEPVEIAGRPHWLVLRHKRFTMPMTIQLADFKREMHPGTEMARAFSSRVTMYADNTERPVQISMNQPLRHRGYTLYQSSYREDPRSGAQFSTFSVVHNYGRLIPYVSTGVVVLGMVLHFLLMLAGRSRRRARA